MKTATCHEISEWNYSCNNRIYTLRTNRSLVLQPEIPLTTTLILFLALKGRKLRGVLFPPTAVAKGGGIKSADVPRQITWEPDYQRIHLTVIFATTPIFLGFINWKGSDPPPTFPQGFPRCLGFLSPSMALHSSTPLCQPPPSSGGGNTTLGGAGDNQTGRNHKNFYLSLFSLHE